MCIHMPVKYIAISIAPLILISCCIARTGIINKMCCNGDSLNDIGDDNDINSDINIFYNNMNN